MGSLTGAWQLTLGDKGEKADMSAMQSRAARLQHVLSRAFSPTLMRVTDDSARHAGHAGARPGGETHYTVLLVSEAFRGQNRLARSRAVHAVLEAEFAGGMHALSLILRTPEEQQTAGRR
jgi:BolA family transcriptional regulator, general stress-responsive regulator